MSQLFDRFLEQGLEDSETAKTLERLSESHRNVGVDEVRGEVCDARGAVMESADTMLKGWRWAEASLRQARDKRKAELLDIDLWGILVGGIAVLGVLWRVLPDSAFPDELVALIAFYLLIGWSIAALVRANGARVSVRKKSRNGARNRFEATLRNQIVVSIREAVNQRLTSFSTTVRIIDDRGLRQLADPEREVSTTAAAELEALISSLDSGSIGLSGPRGSGKTTLIHSFTKGRSMPFNKERIGLTVSAPVKYDAREFVLHLFASLCERVLGEGEEGSVPMGRTAFQRTKRRARAKRYVALAIVFAVAGGGLLLANDPILREEFSELGLLSAAGFLLLFVAGLSAYVGLIFWLSAGPSPRRLAERRRAAKGDPAEQASKEQGDAPERAAEDYLEQIRFQLSYESNVSGGLSLPLGLELGGGSSKTKSRAPWTLPETVEEFRRFAATLSDRFVAIGIDELDKMESDETAREFLNNVKGIFGVTGCYYLVSVSEDAMSAFERRGLPFRDVFDSSFDVIQRVGYLTLTESRIVLGSRVTGLPVPFQCLCHCLAGGLPRDLIRVTRELVHQQEEAESTAEVPEPSSLGSLATGLVKTERRGKLAAALAAGRSHPNVNPEWLTSWLYGQTQEPLRPEGLRERSLELARDSRLLPPPNDDENAQRAHRIAVEMTVLNYYIATVIELFGHESFGETLRDPNRDGQLDPDAERMMELLANARQQFSISPWLVWETINEVRDLSWPERWQDPRQLLAAEPVPGPSGDGDGF